MGGPKRTLTPRYVPPVGSHGTKGPPPPLREGFAIPRKVPRVPEGPRPREPELGGGEGPRPYGRGSASEALRHMADPGVCSKALKADISAGTTKGPTASRLKLWEELATKAGFTDPFDLEPGLIFRVMGALKLAGFRSAQLYMDNAKARHIANGRPWTAQLQQCYRAAVRSCNRGIGNPKQAAPLPLAQLAPLAGAEPLAPGGPCWPARSTILSSWWLLREIEASNARRNHVEVDVNLQKINWRLPSSKTDWKALGAVRSHTCACEFSDRSWCPYHCMVDQLAMVDKSPDAILFPDEKGNPPTKTGWADTFQALAQLLNLTLHYPNGARKYTGHSARATGAIHLAMTQVELWRVQLFGRWGSEVFLHYVRDAPMCQLDKLALETSVHISLNTAKAQLEDLLRRNASEQAKIACPSQAMLEDCEASIPELAPPETTDPAIQNMNGGKVHRSLVYGATFHPKDWKTRCAWHFGGTHTCYRIVEVPKSGKHCCKKCFPEFKAAHAASSNSSDESRSSSSSSSS